VLFGRRHSHSLVEVFGGNGLVAERLELVRSCHVWLNDVIDGKGVDCSGSENSDNLDHRCEYSRELKEVELSCEATVRNKKKNGRGCMYVHSSWAFWSFRSPSQR
jgi:hypothetical protein